MRCRFWGIPFGRKFIATVRVRNISISEEIKTIEEGHTEDDHDIAISLVPWRRRYATRCYRPRYENLGNEYTTEAYDKTLTTKRRLRMLKDTIADKIELKNIVQFHKPKVDNLSNVNNLLEFDKNTVDNVKE